MRDVSDAQHRSWRHPEYLGRPDDELADLSDPCPRRAGGTAYTSTPNSPEAFTVSYASGRWAPAKVLIMPAGTESSQLNGLACVPAGGCVAVGTYTTSAGPSYSFIATLSRARWAVTHLPLPSSDITASLNGITCTAPGDCVAVGSIDTLRYGEMPMVVMEAKGRWQEPSEIMPPAEPTPRYSVDQLWSVACQRARTCVAVGVYNVTAGPSGLVTRPVITIESAGRWLPARGIHAPADTARITGAPGVGVLDAAGLRSVSCAWHGPCLAAGLYFATPGRARALAVSELHGRWSPTQELIPASGATAACNDAFCLITGGGPTLTSPGTAVTYTRGQWGPAVLIRPPADAGQSPGRGYELQIGGVACYPSGRCIAVGSYIDKSVHRVLLVATRS